MLQYDIIVVNRYFIM